VGDTPYWSSSYLGMRSASLIGRSSSPPSDKLLPILSADSRLARRTMLSSVAALCVRIVTESCALGSPTCGDTFYGEDVTGWDVGSALLGAGTGERLLEVICPIGLASVSYQVTPATCTRSAARVPGSASARGRSQLQLRMPRAETEFEQAQRNLPKCQFELDKRLHKWIGNKGLIKYYGTQKWFNRCPCTKRVNATVTSSWVTLSNRILV